MSSAGAQAALPLRLLPGPTEWDATVPHGYEAWATKDAAPDLDARVAATRDPRALRAAMRNPWAYIQDVALANPACPQDIIDATMHRYAGKAQPSRDSLPARCLGSIAARPVNRPEHWAALLATRNPRVMEALAGNPAAPLHILRALLRHRSNGDLRARLAGNPAVPLPLAEGMARAVLSDGQDDCRWGVVSGMARLVAAVGNRPELHQQQRQDLARALYSAERYRRGDKYSTTHSRAATRVAALLYERALHADILDVLMHDALMGLLGPEPYQLAEGLHDAVRRILGRTDTAPRTIAWAARQLAGAPADALQRDPGIDLIIKDAFTHPACPPEALEAACMHPYSELRRHARAHPACPVHAQVAAALLD